MGDGYTKLFSDIVDSSIWDEDNDTRIVWVTLLALCNADGYVRGSVGWLAGKARVSVKDCTKALKIFAAPDPRSRTEDNDGRRIQATERGWIILNYQLFRARNGLSDNPRRVYQRDWMRKKRAGEGVNKCQQVSTESTPASASASVPGTEGVPGEQPPIVPPAPKGFRKPEMAEMELYAAKIGLPITEINKFFDYYEANGWRVGRNPMKSWEAAMRNWKHNFQTYGTKTRSNHGPVVNKRNEGVIDNGTDYGAAARAKLARQAKVARPVDGNDTAPP